MIFEKVHPKMFSEKNLFALFGAYYKAENICTLYTFGSIKQEKKFGIQLDILYLKKKFTSVRGNKKFF